jgi:hypothetical protein
MGEENQMLLLQLPELLTRAVVVVAEEEILVLGLTAVQA